MEESKWTNSRTIILGLIGIALVIVLVLAGKALGVTDALMAIVEAVEAGRGQDAPAVLRGALGTAQAACALAVPYLRRGSECQCRSEVPESDEEVEDEGLDAARALEEGGS